MDHPSRAGSEAPGGAFILHKYAANEFAVMVEIRDPSNIGESARAIEYLDDANSRR